ncbi:cytochrome P450 [Streptomyces sp. NPDC023327]|uniref:cytochrome P450 n=1 Tax=Streptomyces sp. NPDC023327 TaxID=3157088 RepID=UPI0033D07FC1
MRPEEAHAHTPQGNAEPAPPYSLDDGKALQDWFRVMRDERPVHQDPATGAWMVLRYADVAAASLDHATFSSELWRAYPTEWGKSDAWGQGRLTEMDPPRHRLLRALIGKAFNQRTVAGLAPEIETTVERLLDAVDDRSEIDVARDLADPLPVMVIAELIGLPYEDRELLRGWADRLLSFEAGDLAGEDLVKAIDAAGAELLAYLREHYRLRCAAPKDDLFSRLAQAEVDGERLTEEEVVNIGKLLLIGGHVTTACSLASLVFELLRHPDTLTAVRRDAGLIPAAVEESVRYRPAVPNSLRLTTKDTRLGDVTIPAGQFVSLSALSANHDERQFEDPERFDIHRQHNQHVGFGQGVHYCLGAPLARTELRIALTSLLRRFPVLERTDGPLQYYRNPSIAGLRSFPVAVARG